MACPKLTYRPESPTLKVVYSSLNSKEKGCTGQYRFGFNSQEKDNEITGVEGAHNTAEFWMCDTRLGRRWNVDPVDQIYISNYASFKNNPILIIDINGDEPEPGLTKKDYKLAAKFWKK